MSSAAMKSMEKKDYPRPQLFREGGASLNGEWAFAFDPDNIGEGEGWHRRFPGGLKIRVPFSYETVLSGIGKDAPCPAVWYARAFEPGAIAEGKRAILHFEGADYLAKVWVNGEYIGGNCGAYHRFSFDITRALQKGANALTVKCEDGLDARQPRGKQRWYEGGPWACFYTQTTGIWKDVWLEIVDLAHMRGVKITPVFDKYRVDLEFDLSRDALGGELEALVSYGGKAVARARCEALRESFALSLDLTSAADNWQVAEWRPDNPALYDLRFTLYKGGAPVDAAESYFGFREFRTEGNCVLLNRAPFYQKLILDQGYWPDGGLTAPDPGAFQRDLEIVKALGYNGVRMHQKIEDERFLYWADRLGLIVWCEMPAAYEFGGRMMREFTDQWQRVVAQNYNHPSVCVWVPFNESWGVQRIFTDKAQQSFTRGVYSLTKAYDAVRPVISNDGWEHTESDIITLHNYEERGEKLRAQYGDLEGRTLAGANPVHGQKQAFASGFRYGGQPVIVSEYGGIAFATGKEGEWGYGGRVDSEARFIERFRSVTDAIRSLPDVCGYCYTQLADTQQEVNGLLTPDRAPKIALEKIKEINGA
jgi:beta-galactosidase/beta-glucuronidase